MKLILYSAISLSLAGQRLEPGKDPVKEMQKIAQKRSRRKEFQGPDERAGRSPLT